MRLNFGARKHPVNKLRRDALLAQLVADYQPNTTLLRSTCAHLAGTLEQLEVMKPGSPDWQRLVTVAQMLGTALHDAPPETRTPADRGLADMPTPAITVLRDLMLRYESLTERELGQLDILRSAMRGEIALPADD